MVMDNPCTHQHTASIKPVRVTVDPMDENRARELPDGLQFDLHIDGVFIPLSRPPRRPVRHMQLMPTDYEPGSVIEVFFGGELVGAAATVTGYETLEDLISYISPNKVACLHPLGIVALMEWTGRSGLQTPDEEGNSFPLTPMSGVRRCRGAC